MKQYSRVFFLSISLAVLVLAGCGEPASITDNVQASATVWPMPDRGNLQRTNVYSDTGTPALNSMLWTSQDFEWLFEQPIVDNNKAYYAPFGSFGIHNLQALDLMTGQVAWSVDNIDHAVRLTVADKVIYYSKDNHLRAMNTETQQEKWVIEEWAIGKDVGVVRAPLVSEGTVYFGTDNGGFHAIDAETGQEKWTYTVEIIDHEIPHGFVANEPVLLGDSIIFGTFYEYVYSLNKNTGQLNWRTAIGHLVTSEFAVFDGILYFTSATDVTPPHPTRIPGVTPLPTPEYEGVHEPPPRYFDYALYAIEARTGDVVWKIDSSMPTSSSANDCSDPLVVDGGVVYCADTYDNDANTGIIYALDAKSGQQVWKKVAENELTSGTLALYKGVLYTRARSPYTANVGSHLYAFDAKTGDDKWRFHTGDYFIEPVIADGVLYLGVDSRGVGTEDKGRLIALDPMTGMEVRSIDLHNVTLPPIIQNGIAYVVNGEHGKQKLVAIP
ncbi:MAG: PQQ-binding-like beta-propeller repeat protein [Chloroflexia bacterium]